MGFIVKKRVQGKCPGGNPFFLSNSTEIGHPRTQKRVRGKCPGGNPFF
jgi:hypothetical protein